jgi:hypothetical protein
MRTTSAAIVLTTVLLGAVHAEPAGTDFGAEARVMFRVAACGGDDAIPARFSARSIAAHCKEMAQIYASYRKAWIDEAQGFISRLRPRDLPRVAVYPFGGGDLSSALAVYPDATELTTISLEAAGDVRVIDAIKSAKLDEEVDLIGNEIHRLYYAAHSTTKSLQAASHAELPGTIMFALAGLAVHGMEPVALRYFDIEPDGSLSYLSNAQLDERAAEFAVKKLGAAAPKKIPHYWYEQVSAFANVEIQYKKPGETEIRVHRHIGWNLGDPYLRKHPELLRHLAAKGTVTMLTKGASYLLWRGDFALIRSYMLDHLAWMLSDSTGIPPQFARRAGMVQVTYGRYDGAFLEGTDVRHDDAFIELWKSQKTRRLPFRFGYVDKDKQAHLVVTRPKG